MKQLKKKIVCLLSMCAFIVNGGISALNAEEVVLPEIRGILSAGNTLHFSCQEDEAVSECIWYVSDSLDGTYNQVGSGLIYATEITNQDKYYYASATLANGDECTTEAILVEGYEKIKYEDFINEDLSAYREKSNSEYVFTVEGQDFVLADTIDTSDTARFVVIADQTYGKLNLPGLGTLESHPDTEIVNVMDNILPEAISKYIDRTIYFGDSINGWNQNWDQYIGGMSAVSVKELRKYKEKIGLSVENYQTAGTKVSWVLRTAAANQTVNGNYAYGISIADGELSVSLASNFRKSPDHEVRPIFYLDKDFLIDNIDYQTAAPAIKRIMRETYSYDEMLAAGYTDKELTYFTDTAEIGGFTELKISKAEDNTLSINYVFEGLDGTEELLTYQWYVSDNADDGYAEIENAGGTSLNPENVEHDQYVKAAIYLPNGECFYSNAIQVKLYDDTFVGTIENYSVRGILSAGNTLHFAYESDNGVTDDDIINCKWYVSDSADGRYTLAGKGSTYTASAITTDKYYYAEAIIKNGNTYKTEPVLVKGYEEIQYRDFASEDLSVYRTESNPGYIFTVDGQDFVLVDTIAASDTARFVVVADQSYGKLNLPGAGTQETHPDDEMVNLMDNILPETISSYIDRTVYFEGSVSIWNQYWGPYTGGVSVPSAKELRQYKDILGLWVENYQNPGEKVSWVLRTNACRTESGNYAYGIKSDETGFSVDAASNFRRLPDYEVRPIFYLSKDFFKSVKLDETSMGENVIEIIKNNYAREELSDIYSDKMLEEVFGYKAYYVINSADVNSSEKTVNVSVSDNYGKGNSYLMSVLYNAENQLKECVMVKLDTALNETKDFSAGFNTALESGDFVKCMIFGKEAGEHDLGGQLTIAVE